MTDSSGETQEWRDEGSGPAGHVVTVRTHPSAKPAGPVRGAITRAQARLDEAFRAFIEHTQTCGDCRAGSVDCEDAAILRQVWRDAKDAS